MSSLGASLLDFVYPPHCAACGVGLQGGTEMLCAGCWRDVRRTSDNRCHRCSCPLDAQGDSATAAAIEGDCPNCSSWEMASARVLVMGVFDGALQEAVHAVKFKRQQRLGIELGRCFGRLAAFLDDFDQIDVFVPIPLHPSRQRERGYNQSELIARGLSEALGGKPVRTDLVERRRATVQQATLDADKRHENLRDAFEVAGEIPSDKRLGLVDDVVTTAATLGWCANALAEAGAPSVWGVALGSPFPAVAGRRQPELP